MAENSRFGREPIEVVEIGQDFCTRTFSEQPCRAGQKENIIPNSVNLTDNTLYAASNSFAITDPGFLSPDGSSEVVRIETDSSIDTQYTQSSSNYSGVPVITEVYFSTLFKRDETTDAPRVDFFATNDTNFTGVDINPFNGNVDLARSGVIDFGSIDLGGGWYRIYFSTIFETVDSSATEVRVLYRVTKVIGTGEAVFFSSPQINVRELRDYTPTTGQEVRWSDTQPCFNTRSTCQDPTNYDRGVLPLKFVDKRSPIPNDDYYIPSLTGLTVTPSKLNPGGANRNASALGERAAVSLTFLDHPYNDRLVDKYRLEREYNPVEQGTFWTKWRARNQYYMQRPITLRSGYLVNGEIVDEITRAFVITGFSGPDSSGRVQIKGKDVLTLAEDSKAQAPFVSTGRLGADIGPDATSFILTPSGVGNAEYDTSGWVRINREVMSFTRSGDTMTVVRAQFGTEADEHDGDDTVQQCLRYQSQEPQEIIYDLLRNYAGIPDIYLDKAGWDAEAFDYLKRLYSAIITEPEGVSKLISEMCQQMYFTIWFDERVSLVKLRAVRLAENDEVFELDDQMHLIENSVSWKDLNEQLITQVWVYYGQSNPTEKLDQADNYAAVSVTIDPLAEGPDKHNLRRVKKIFSRWISAGNAGAAEDLGRRLLNRYGNAPREVSFSVDAKDNYLWLGDFIRLTNRLNVNSFGLPVPSNLQVFQAQESSLGSDFQFTAQEFIPALSGAGGGDVVEDPSVRTIPVTSDFLNLNLRTLHDEQFGAPSGTETITFEIRSGITIGGYAAGGGINVEYDRRNTGNDTYNAGPSSITGVEIGTLQILQRNSISSPRTVAGGTAYDGLGTTDYSVKEYPISYALRTGTWPTGTKIKLVVESGAKIVGEGGNGSTHALQEVVSADSSLVRKAVRGGDGGDALIVEYEIEINNGGIIAGGGGGGGCSPAIGGFNDELDIIPGGGGAGLEISDTSTIKKAGELWPRPEEFVTSEAAVGSTTSGGRGARDVLDLPALKYDQRGGRGGNLASSGQASSFYQFVTIIGTPVEFTLSPGQGGQSGKAIRSGRNLITWVNKGDVRGAES